MSVSSDLAESQDHEMVSEDDLEACLSYDEFAK